MSLSQQTVLVTGNPVENNVVVTVSNARGIPGTSSSNTWDSLTGTSSHVPFEPVTPPSYAEGLVFYDTDDKSLVYYNDEADVAMNIGRELWVRVRNDSGAPILNGKVVYINDALGQLPTIRLARADSAVTSRVIGIATHDIGNNEFGYVTTAGEVKGLNTVAFQDGDLLFLSATNAGEMTTTAPTAPNRVIQVSTVLHSHISQGKLYCHPENDSVPSTGIVDSTATGRALITAADASSGRTALGLTSLATTTPGIGVAEAIGIDTGTTGSVLVNGSAITGTTGTFSGALTTGSQGTNNTLTVGNQIANSSSAKIRINGKSGGGTLLHCEWVMRSNAYLALDTYAVTDAIRVDSSNGRVAFIRGIEGNTFHNGFLSVGSTPVTTEDGGMLVVNKGYATTTGNHHAIRVKSTDSVLATGAGINFFDAQAIVSSPNNIDHIAEFQARSTKSGAGTMSDWYGYWAAPVFSGGTTIRAAHVHVEDASGAGALTTQYGFRVMSLTKGTNNYGVVIEGQNPSVFGGSTPNANSILDLQSTTKAFMPPRMTKAQRNAIPSATEGMVVYQTDNTPGIRTFNGTNWVRYTETTD